MKNIIVTVNPHANHASIIKEETLRLPVLAPISSRRLGNNPIFGYWYSESRFLGKGLWGKYYVRDKVVNHDRSASAHMLRTESNSIGTRIIMNPVAFFFDLLGPGEDFVPFLCLQQFDPSIRREADWFGVGHFVSVFLDIDRREPDVLWRDA